MHPMFEDWVKSETRRQFFKRGTNALGMAALGSLLGSDAKNSFGANLGGEAAPAIGPHFAGKAKQVIYLHMVGGPSQMDLFDYKPQMGEWFDKDLPDTVRMGQRLTTMTSGQKRFPIAPSKFKFAQHGQSGMWVSELLPEPGQRGRRDVLHPQHAHRGHQS